MIGDTVNTAARLEGLSKDLGYPLVCSAACAEELGSVQGLVHLGLQQVRGRAPIDVYGWRPEPASPVTQRAAGSAAGRTPS